MSATSAQIVLRREREVKALQLRIKGHSYEEIAVALGCAKSTAHDMVIGRLRQLNDVADREATHLRRIESERLLFAMNAIARAVELADTDAVREWRQLSESMRKLWGLDAPTKIAPTSPDGESEYTGLSDAELEREFAKAVAAANGAAE